LVVKKATLVWLAVACLTAGLAAAGSQSQGKEKKKDKQNKKTAAASDSGVQIEVSFRTGEKNTIREWFSDDDNLSGLPPGLAKREELPPGLQKHLVKNGTLPAGLQKKLQPLPPGLESRLPPPPDGSRRVILYGSVILLGEKTAKVFDIIEDVWDLTH
jgi:hypothetical protein